MAYPNGNGDGDDHDAFDDDEYDLQTELDEGFAEIEQK